MKQKGKKVIIVSSVLTGVLLLSGVGIAVGKGYAYNNKLEDAKIEINDHEKSLEVMNEELSQVINEDGFIVGKVDIKSIENQLNNIFVTASEYDVKEGDLDQELVVVVSSKKDVEKLATEIKNKVEMEENVNALFVSKAINGVDVKEVAVNKEAKETEVATLLDKVEDKNGWGKAVRGLLEGALDQVKHNEATGLKVDTLSKEETPTRNSYNEVKELVGVVKNEEVKKGFKGKLADVLTKVEKEEKKVAEAKAQQEKEEAERLAKEQAQVQQQTQSTNTSSNGVVNNGTANNQTTTTAPGGQNVQTKPSTNNQTTAPKKETASKPSNNQSTQTAKPSTNQSTSKPSTSQGTSKPSTQPSKPSIPSKPTQSKPSNDGGSQVGKVEDGDRWHDVWEGSDSDIEAVFGK